MKLHTLNKTLFFCFILIPVLFQNVNAQAFLFKVIASAGNPVCLKPPSTKWLNIKTGDKILPGYELKLGTDDYLGLLNYEGRSLELKKAGLYGSNELNKNIPKGNNNLQKFADYVLNESAANKKKSEDMKNLGAVVRARSGLIESFFPDNTDLLNPQIEPTWYSAGPGVTYVFKIFSPGGTSLFIKETKDTSLAIDLTQFGLVKEQNYSWCVFNSQNLENNSDTSTFRILSDINNTIISDSLKLFREYLDVNSAVGQFLIVKYFEAKNLNSDALKVYESLVKSYPQVGIYTDNYLLFLTKQNLTKKTEILLSAIKK